MPMKAKLAMWSLAGICLCLATASMADEGMFPLFEMDSLDWDGLSARGLRLEAAEIYSPDGPCLADAVAAVGATGSFVSEEGLMVTNHHVAFRAIQQASSAGANLLSQGFFARDRSEEIPAEGYHVWVPLSTEDVSDRVLAACRGIEDGHERFLAIEAERKRIVAEAESGRDLRCEVAELYGGARYILHRYFYIKDVRIVCVPPLSLGKYGGDIDNWMWPRHTADYSFLRAYVAPDGSSAEYAPENRPFRPRHWLPISSEGVHEGDLTMIIGFPGRTNRYASSYELSYLFEDYYPLAVGDYKEGIALREELSRRSPEAAIRLASGLAGLNNRMKNNQGQLDGYRHSKILPKRRAQEAELMAFLREHADLQKNFGGVLPSLKRLYARKRSGLERDYLLGSLPRSSRLLRMALRICRWARERPKEDADREAGYQDRDRESLREDLRVAQINLLPEAESSLLARAFGKMLDLPAGERVALADSIFLDGGGDGQLQSWADRLVSATALKDARRRLELMDLPEDSLRLSADPFLRLAWALLPELDGLRDRNRRFEGEASRLEPMLNRAYAAWGAGAAYPDANGTRRINFGSVEAYVDFQGRMQSPHTWLDGLLAKATGVDPFIVPEELLRVWRSGDFGRYADRSTGKVPVDFLTTNDSTGGNSGSPVINGRGELVGLLFDGNYESISADYFFEPEWTRSINVDIRFVLFLLDKVYHQDSLLAELTIH